MLIVTIAALVMAASLGWFAYRLLRDEQRRADARVALLTAAIDSAGGSDWDAPTRAGHVGFMSPRAVKPPLPASPPTPTPTSGAASSPTLPELVFLEDETTSGRDFVSERADWMEAASGRATRAGATSLRIDGNGPMADLGGFDSTASRTAGIFGESPEPQRRSGFVIAMLIALLTALFAVGYTWFSASTATPEPAGANVASRSTAPAAGGIPLELVSLAHEQHEGALVVRGVVRNPVAGSDRLDVVASVMLLDGAGGVLGSGRAPLRTAQLRPGQETVFAVELASHRDVRRYRVTFRAPDGSLVAHADRRTRSSSTSS